MMINMTLEALVNLMKKNGYKADIQEDTQQVYTIYKVEGQEFPIFLRIFNEGQLLQIIVFIPCELPDSVVPDMARFLHLLNKELDLPGFGMDEMTGVVFYRLMLPSHKNKMDAELLLSFLQTFESVCKMFAAPIQAMSRGQVTLQDILTKAKEIDSRKKK